MKKNYFPLFFLFLCCRTNILAMHHDPDAQSTQNQKIPFAHWAYGFIKIIYGNESGDASLEHTPRAHEGPAGSTTSQANHTSEQHIKKIDQITETIAHLKEIINNYKLLAKENGGDFCGGPEGLLKRVEELEKLKKELECAL